jgi:hypothetical protein
MLMPAPIAVAIPAMKAYSGLCVESATAKIGERRERPVDQSGQSRLNALEDELLPRHD